MCPDEMLLEGAVEPVSQFWLYGDVLQFLVVLECEWVPSHGQVCRPFVGKPSLQGDVGSGGSPIGNVGLRSPILSLCGGCQGNGNEQ